MAAEAHWVSRPSAQSTRRIRILYIIDSLWGLGGAELSLLRLTKNLPRDQFECRVLTFHSNEASRPFLERFDCPVDHWQLKNIYDFNSFRVAARLRKLVQEREIDIVHTFFQTSDLWAGPIAKMSGAKVLISSRRDMGIMRSPKHHLGYRLVKGMFDQIQTVSEAVRRYTLETDRVDPQLTLTIYNGIDTLPEVSDRDIEQLRQTIKIEPDSRVITCVGNVRPAKGIDVLARAAALVNREVPDARFVIAGGLGTAPAAKAYAEDIFRLSHSLGIEPVFRLIGQTKHVGALLNLSDIFVLPSRSEGLSNALLEAMRAELSCVATAVGGNPEVVVEGVTGFLVPPDNPEALAGRLLELLGNPAMRRQMGMAGRYRVLQKFTTKTMVSSVTAAYEQLLLTKGSGLPGRTETESCI